MALKKCHEHHSLTVCSVEASWHLLYPFKHSESVIVCVRRFMTFVLADIRGSKKTRGISTSREKIQPCNITDRTASAAA